MMPGTKAGYHPTSTWTVLGEVVRRVDGRPFERYVREEIFLPLGMADCFIGMGHDEFRLYQGSKRIAALYTAGAGGVDKDGQLHEESAVRACIPGGNMRGPAAQASIRLAWRFVHLALLRLDVAPF